MKFRAIRLCIFLLATTGFAAQAQAPTVTTIASYPHGNFLENLTVDGTGRVIFTNYMGKTIMQWHGSGEPVSLAELDVHPVAVLALPNEIIVSAHGKSFAEGPGFTATNLILILDPNGKVKRRFPAPAALFLNGMVKLSSRQILIADSLAAKIWSFDPVTGRIAPWLSDPLLGSDPAHPSPKPGANGLKIRGSALYVSNSARGAIYRVPLAKGRPGGPLSLFVASGPIDDFTFLSDGTIAAATHSKNLVHIAKSKVTDIIADGCDSCTSVVPYGPDKSLIVLTTGDFVEGGTAPARVLRVASPVN